MKKEKICNVLWGFSSVGIIWGILWGIFVSSWLWLCAGSLIVAIFGMLFDRSTLGD